MKNLSLILTILFSIIIFNSTSYAEWKKVGTTIGGVEVYIDFERIRKHNSYVYSWVMYNYPKVSEQGMLSDTQYIQVECGSFKYKRLQSAFYKLPMAQGQGLVIDVTKYPEQSGWKYPMPSSTIEMVLNKIC